MSDNPYDNIAGWQWRWAKWARYAQMTPSEIHEETYKGGHAHEAYNGMSYLVTMQHIALMRRLGKVASYIVTPDNSLMLAKLVELGFAVRDHDTIDCVPDEDDDRVIEGYRGPLPDRQRVHPSVFAVADGLLAILRGELPE
jgi:hypothetical protein